MKFPALGIRRKLALTTLVSLLPLLLLGVALSVYLISDTLRQENLRQEDIAFTSVDNELKTVTEIGDANIRFLATLPAIQEIIRARSHQGVDPVSGVALETVLQREQGVFSLEISFAIIKESRGSHFNPDVVDAFFAIEDEIISIKEKYIDRDVSLLLKMVDKFS